MNQLDLTHILGVGFAHSRLSHGNISGLRCENLQIIIYKLIKVCGYYKNIDRSVCCSSIKSFRYILMLLKFVNVC